MFQVNQAAPRVPVLLRARQYARDGGDAFVMFRNEQLSEPIGHQPEEPFSNLLVFVFEPWPDEDCGSRIRLPRTFFEPSKVRVEDQHVGFLAASAAVALNAAGKLNQ